MKNTSNDTPATAGVNIMDSYYTGYMQEQVPCPTCGKCPTCGSYRSPQPMSPGWRYRLSCGTAQAPTMTVQNVN